MELKINGLEYNNLFSNLNFNVSSNSVTSIIGKNSIGKSLILSVIAGNLLGDEELRIDDLKINKNSTKEATNTYRKNISYLSSNSYKELFNINILEDLKYGQDSTNFEILEDLLYTFNLKNDILRKNYMEISTSEKQKVALVYTFLKNSKIILLDNPTMYLDNKCIQNLIKLIRKEKRKDKIIIITSNNSDFVLQASDDVSILDNKKILIKDNKYNVLGNEKLMNKIDFEIPNIIKFQKKVLELKGVKLSNRDNINDLIKDIYRSVK